MIAAEYIVISGLAAGFLLVRRFPSVPRDARGAQAETVSIIIPARDEEHNLAGLLTSIPHTAEVIVVDDGSRDATAAVAIARGARVIRAPAPPVNWVGKAWACQQGFDAASGDLLVFLDADTRFAPEGLERIVSCASSLPSKTVLSVLPFHRCRERWEDLSLFFHLMMAFGAAGFTRLGKSGLVGPSLIIRRELYEHVGGHASVRGEVLENFAFAERIRRHGGTSLTLNAADTLWTRMFPQGFTQLCESWSKAFVAGAGKTPIAVLVLSTLWLAGGISVITLALQRDDVLRLAALLGYFAFAKQVAWAARQIGNYRWSTFLLYPIPLLFYFFLFGYSLWKKVRPASATWKGRRV